MALSSNSSNERILSVNFNQDYTCLSVGTNEGLKIFTTEPFRKCFERKSGAMKHVSMLYSTSLLALVGAGQQASLSPRRLQLFNSTEHKTICELNFVSTILNVHLSRKRLVVVLERKIHIFDVSAVKILITIDTEPNPKGICALACNGDQAYIAYPYGPEMNDVMLFNICDSHPMNVMKAHKGPISAMAFNADGTLLATASSKGTVLRVFSVPDSNMLFTFRRGSSAALIHSIAFNEDSSMLCVSSDKETVHVFQIPTEHRQGKKRHNVGSIGDTITNMWDTIRDFAHMKLRGVPAGVRSVVGFNGENIMVATETGHFFQFGIAKDGGECWLDKEYQLFDHADQALPSNTEETSGTSPPSS
eukprot:gb/GECH01004478.1/.p1 GENE.gb/GECH01004478.1/~~gb/GECH01004478.1/.p1  ORF type:complete len:361 (+),score=87.83 gb/GECH01004478.1/:1-1083(+)